MFNTKSLTWGIIRYNCLIQVSEWLFFNTKSLTWGIIWYNCLIKVSEWLLRDYQIQLPHTSEWVIVGLHQVSNFQLYHDENKLQVIFRWTDRFRAKQSLVFILNAACSAEKQQIPLVFGLTDLMWNLFCLVDIWMFLLFSISIWLDLNVYYEILYK